MAEISRHQVKQARVEIIDPDCPPGEEPFVDYITATQHEYSPLTKGGEPAQQYWLISGDNTGSQQLILWPYQVQPMIELLRTLRVEDNLEDSE